MAQLIQGGEFRFVARSANSTLGPVDPLSYGYDLVFKGERLIANLPYFGRAYSYAYGSEGGVKFDLKADSLIQKWNEKKKLFDIATSVSDSREVYAIRLTAGLDGYAELKINFRDRSWISYYGTIEKIPETKGN